MKTVTCQFPAQDIGDVEPLVLPYIASALKKTNGEIKAEDIVALAKVGKAQIWGTFEADSKHLLAVTTTQVLEYPRANVLYILTLGGEGMEVWSKQLDFCLRLFCQLHSLKRIYFLGRKGFERALEPLGFKPIHVAYVKEVEP